jgi:predicted PurR-regulated permease PerM
MGRVSTVTFTVLVAFLAILAFATIVVQEASSLAEQIPEYRYNIEAKIRSLEEVILSDGVFHRVASMFRDLGRELRQAESQISAPTDHGPASGTSSVEPTRPIPVEIRQPDFEPLQIVQSLI